MKRIASWEVWRLTVSSSIWNRERLSVNRVVRRLIGGHPWDAIVQILGKKGGTVGEGVHHHEQPTSEYGLHIIHAPLVTFGSASPPLVLLLEILLLKAVTTV